MTTTTLKTLRQYQSLLTTYLRPLKRQVLLLTVLLFGGIGLRLWTPQILRDFIDLAQSTSASTAGISGELTRQAVLFFALVLVGRVMQLGTTYVTQDVRWRATNEMRGDLAGHCLHLDLPFHNAHTPGSIIERIDGDVNVLSNFFSQLVIQIVGNAVLLIGILVLLAIEDWRIGVAYMVFVGTVGYVLTKSVAVTAPMWKEERELRSQVLGFLEERLSGTEDIRANGAVQYVLRRLKQLKRRNYLLFRKALMTSTVMNWGFTEGMLALGSALALGLGGLLLLRGELTIGAVYLIFHYNTMLQWPLNQLARQMRDLQSATGSIERIQELFSMTSKVQEPSPARATRLPSGPLPLQFADVNFGYEDDGPITLGQGSDSNPGEAQPALSEAEGLVLKSVSWQVAAGDVVGILGRTGSGKTTITRLLCRLYDPQAGSVRIGNVSLPDVPLGDLRHRVGIVTQDVQLFEATVRDNLTMFDATIDDATILSVVDQLGLTPWLGDLPEGLDTELGTSSAGLSAGEAQLLAFTRVFLRDPGLVILDEASSRLDPLTERLMERAIDRLFRGRTGVIVAHRLATVQRADKILILENGEIAEFGARMELAADPGSRFSHLLRTGMEEVLV